MLEGFIGIETRRMHDAQMSRDLRKWGQLAEARSANKGPLRALVGGALMSAGSRLAGIKLEECVE